MRKTPQPLRRRVRVFLAQHDMTQRDLADRLQIAQSHLSSILAGRETPSLPVGVMLETLSGIPARDFIAKSKHDEHPVARR
jgi:transcriptional regulator with XRE-family HTH domain